MSLPDLQRLVKQATPRVEDVRSPDRTDFVRREHGHLTLREIVDALDALEFSADVFVEIGQELAALEEPTAVHAAYKAISGLHIDGLTFAEACPPPVEPLGEEESVVAHASEEQAEVVDALRKRGAELFKAKDFAAAEEAYSEAIRSLPRGHPELHTLYSNRCAARLQLAEAGVAEAADASLADARKCVVLAPAWPKAYFREGSCLRRLGLFAAAVAAFRKGRSLEPGNKDWDKEIEKTEQQRSKTVVALVRQLVFSLMPDLLWAWSRGGDADGVLQVQINGALKDLGIPKWRRIREGLSTASATLRYAFVSREGYFANLVANLQRPPQDAGAVGLVGLAGGAFKIADANKFVKESAGQAVFHLDVGLDDPKSKVAVLCRMPCDDMVNKFFGTRKEPEAPKVNVESTILLQKSSGFPTAFPRLLGFQSLPGELMFPVVVLERDAPQFLSS